MTFADYARISSPDPSSTQDLATKNYVDNLRRTYMTRAYRSTAYTMPATASTLVQPAIYNFLSQGSSAYYSTTTGYYTCPVAGVYLARASMSASINAALALNCQLFLNDVQNAIVNATNGTAGASAIISEVAAIVNVAAGDTISAGWQTSMASAAIRVVAAEVFFTVALLGVL